MKKNLFFVIFLLLSVSALCQKDTVNILEFRLAETDYNEELTEITNNITGQIYYLYDEVVLNDQDIVSAESFKEQNFPAVRIIFNEHGKKIFSQITAENIGKHLAIIYKGEILSVPLILTEITEGEAIITGLADQDEADHLAELLNQK